MGADIARGGGDGPTGPDQVLIHVWILSLEGPRALPDPLVLTAVDQVTSALAPLLTDLATELSTACKAPLVLRAED